MRRVWNLLRRRRLDADVAEEIECHRALIRRELEAGGLSSAEAMLAARRAMGDTLRAREDARAVWLPPSFDALRQDWTQALHALRRQRATVAAVVITLTLGIGANAVLFSAVEAILLQPLPFREPERLVWIAEYVEQLDVETTFQDRFVEWREHARSFDTMAVFNVVDRYLSNDDGGATQIRSVVTSESVGRLFGVTPVIGRDFVAADLAPGRTSEDIAILSDRLFRQRFGGDPAIVGTRLNLQGRSALVIGVLPREFRMPLRLFLRPGSQIEPDIVFNYAVDPRATSFPVQVLARLRPEASLAAARSELEALHPPRRPTAPGAPRNRLLLTPLHDRVVGQTRTALFGVWGAVAFVLLLACVNVTNLLLARSTSRRAEMAVRAALGAGRGRLLRQLLAESSVMAAAGGVGGLLVAYGGVRFLAAWGPADIPRLRDATLDASVIWFSVAICAMTAIVIGIAPALVTSQTQPVEVLKDGGPSKSLSRGQRRMQGGLVVSQVALALMLLIGAGLMLRSVWAVRAAADVFTPERVLTFRVVSSNPQLSARAIDHARFLTGLASDMERVPGVRAASAWSHGVTQHVLSGWGAVATPPHLVASLVTPRFVAASGARIVAGRGFEERDVEMGSPVVLVNEAAARLLVPAGASMDWLLGKPLLGARIAGVVSDFRWRPDASVDAQIFRLFTDAPVAATAEILVRTAADPMAAAGGLRDAVHRYPRVDMTEIETLDERLSGAIAPRRLQTALFFGFAALGLALTAVGIYGVLSHAVAARVQEIGIRVTLGAAAGDVLWAVLARGMTQVAAGLAIGVILSLSLARLMSGLLYGVSAHDARTYATMCVLLIAVAVVAAYFPARAALGLNPVTALRGR